MAMIKSIVTKSAWYAALAPAAFLMLVDPVSTIAEAASDKLTVKSRFDISIGGFVVGQAGVTASINGDRYEMSGSGEARGVSRLFTDASGTVTAAGKIGNRDTIPASYGYRWVEDGKVESLDMTIRRGAVSRIKVAPEPKPKDKEDDRIALTRRHLSNILDPMSALIWPSRDGQSRRACNRTVPIFDGVYRYDIVMSYKRRDKYRGDRRAYRGAVLVCKVKFKAIAGHRSGKREIRDLERNSGMEVWLAPIQPAGDGRTYMIPVRFDVPTRVGLINIAMDRFSIINK